VVVEILYKASTKTFHSPRILRHLFTALTAVGNSPDAVLALNTYLELVQRAKDRIAKGHMEKDFDDDKTIFETVAEGIRVVCGLVGDGQRGMEMASIIERWIEEWNVRDAGMLSDAYRGIGFANATWARKTTDGEARPDAQKAAIGAFRRGLSYDILDADGWYGLALVQVEFGDIDSAMESAKRGLTSLTRLASDDEDSVLWDRRGAYRRRAVPLLHLLALLMTATEDFEGARQACENVFELLGDNIVAFRDMGVGEKEGILEAKMTQIAIEEALQGVETAVAMADTLLDLYGRLFEITNPLVPDLAIGAFENVHTDSIPSTRPSTASRKLRLLGSRGLKKEFAASATTLPHESFGTQSTGSDGDRTVKKRPKSGHQSLHHPTGLKWNPNAPRIQITEHGSSGDSAGPPKKQSRPKSVSGGTIRRMKSLGSLHSASTTSARDRNPPPEVPTPPLPSSTTTSSVSLERSPTGSVKGREHHRPHLFHTLKLKLQRHHLQNMGSRVSIVPTMQLGDSSTSFVPTGVRTPVDGAGDTVLDRSDLPRAEDIPNNLSRSKLPHPISAVASRITDETRGKGAEPRSVKRPTSLPEPKLKEEDERKRTGGALRLVWMFVGGLYRRAGYLQDATMAVEEADGLGGSKEDGKADVLTEVRYVSPGPPGVVTDVFLQTRKHFSLCMKARKNLRWSSLTRHYSWTLITPSPRSAFPTSC
jgi:tetratricopeptide (TPR) repeat protein